MDTQLEEHVTLFCEGDGHVCVVDGHSRVVFNQKERNVLDYVSSLFEGGHIYWDTSGVWRLVFNGSYCVPLLEMFTKRVVGRSFLNRLNGVLAFVDMSLAIQHPLTLSGFVGFWDAEGSSCNSPTISVSQKDREIPDLIAELFGGSVCLGDDGVHYWTLCGKKADALCETVLAKSRVVGKAEELRKHFGEERGKQQREYGKAHRKEKQEYNESYYDVHRGEITAKQRALREWMKLHPKEVERLREKL